MFKLNKNQSFPFANLFLKLHGKPALSEICSPMQEFA